MKKSLLIVVMVLITAGVASAEGYSQLVFSASPDRYDNRLDVVNGEPFQLYAIMLGAESLDPYPYGFEEVTWAVLAGC